MQIRFHQWAILEYQQALWHYKAISDQLGNRFKAAMDHAVNRILADPTALPADLGSFRRIRMKKFPFVVFFCMLPNNTIGVLAVAHTSRRPGYWRHRKPDDV